ncbi:hypothetical protein [Roseateles cavernae]|uniref:hypothetical protein n=1 Tax=Roseateles cavernae TaxID=3153578 RepID=UPI0032E4AEC3
MQQALPAAAPHTFHFSCQPDMLPNYLVWEHGDDLGPNRCRSMHGVHDDFGALQTQPYGALPLEVYPFPHEVDDEAMAAFWPHDMLGRFAPPAPPQPPRIRAEILPADEGDFIGYAAEIKISTARPLEGEPFYLLNIGSNDLVYATRSELQGLVAAAAAVLSLQLTPCAGDVDLVDDADTLAALAEVLQ